MKKYSIIGLSAVLMLLAVPAFSQYDDIYYNPQTDADYYSYNDDRSNQYSDYREDDLSEYYTEDEYDYYNDYDFYYTSRIRRFHRPMYGFGYYDPIYVDAYYYDPFVMPGRTVLIYDDFYSYRDWVRWRNWRRWGWNSARFNRWDLCFQPGFRSSAWGFTNFGFNRWYRPGFSIHIGIGYNNWGFNNWGWDPYWGRWGNRWFNAYPSAYWGGGYYAGNYNYAPDWGYGNEYNRDIYYGPRTGGSGTGPAAGIRNRNNGISPGTINNDDRVTGVRRDLGDRIGTNRPERIRTGQVETGNTRAGERRTAIDRSANTDRNRTRVTTPANTRRTTTKPRTVTPRQRTTTTTRSNRANTSIKKGARNRSGNNNDVERRQLGGQLVPVTPSPQYDRLERYRRPSRSGDVQRKAMRTQNARNYNLDRNRSSRYPSYDRNRTNRYPNYNRSRSATSRNRSSRIRRSTPSRQRSSSIRFGRSSSSRSSSINRSRSSSRSSGTKSRSSSNGRKRGNNDL